MGWNEESYEVGKNEGSFEFEAGVMGVLWRFVVLLGRYICSFVVVGYEWLLVNIVNHLLDTFLSSVAMVTLAESIATTLPPTATSNSPPPSGSTHTQSPFISNVLVVFNGCFATIFF